MTICPYRFQISAFTLNKVNHFMQNIFKISNLISEVWCALNYACWPFMQSIPQLLSLSK